MEAALPSVHPLRFVHQEWHGNRSEHQARFCLCANSTSRCYSKSIPGMWFPLLRGTIVMPSGCLLIKAHRFKSRWDVRNSRGLVNDVVHCGMSVVTTHT